LSPLEVHRDGSAVVALAPAEFVSSKEPQMQTLQRTVERRAKRSFLGENQNVPYRRGMRITVDPGTAEKYDAQGLTEPMPKAPTKAAAAASAAANKAQKNAKPTESKESTAKGKDGLEPWDGAMSEEAYVAKYDGSDTPAVVEKLKLAKARIKAGVSQGASA
jgi:hypothetical protein